MQPTQITIRDIPNSQALEDQIRKKADKLSHFYNRINSVRVVLTVPQKHKHQGKLFAIHIDLKVPGKELAAHKSNEDAYVAIRDGFHAIQHQLETYASKRRGYVKSHPEENVGYISRLFPTDGYGFIQGIDGQEYYFSATNASNPSFERLDVGDMVHFLAEPASEGPQAHRVTREKNHFLVV